MEAPREVAQEGMFWDLVPEDVIETPVKLNSADFECEWRRRKHKNGKGIETTLDRIRIQSKNCAGKRICTEGIIGFFVDDRHF